MAITTMARREVRQGREGILPAPHLHPPALTLPDVTTMILASPISGASPPSDSPSDANACTGRAVLEVRRNAWAAVTTWGGAACGRCMERRHAGG